MNRARIRIIGILFGMFEAADLHAAELGGVTDDGLC
jgi:hypothetical protein